MSTDSMPLRKSKMLCVCMVLCHCSGCDGQYIDENPVAKEADAPNDTLMNVIYFSNKDAPDEEEISGVVAVQEQMAFVESLRGILMHSLFQKPDMDTNVGTRTLILKHIKLTTRERYEILH